MLSSRDRLPNHPVTDIFADLNQRLPSSPASSSPVGENQSPSNPPSRRRWLVPAIIGGVVVILGGGFFANAQGWLPFLSNRSTSQANNNVPNLPANIGTDANNQIANSNANSDGATSSNVDLSADANTNTGISSSADSDGDGLTDSQEKDIYQTDPKKKDSDGDGYDDKTEVDSGYNPNGSGTLSTSPSSAVTTTKPPTISIKYARPTLVAPFDVVMFWSTDVPTSGVVSYGGTISYDKSVEFKGLAIGHQMRLPGEKGKTYHYSIKACTAPPTPVCATTTDQTFGVLTVSDVDIQTEGENAVVSWTTNLPATSQVFYVQTNNVQDDTVYEKTKPVDTLQTQHSVPFPLKGELPYAIYVRSCESGDSTICMTNRPFYFRAPSPSGGPKITDIKITPVANGVDINWQTDFETDFILNYGETTPFGYWGVDFQTFRLAHTANIPGEKGTLYQFTVSACTKEPNAKCSSTAAQTFTVQ